MHLFSETLDQLGTFTRTVADAARLASALADAGRIAPAPAPLAKPPRFAYLDGFPWTQDVDCDADDTLDAAATTLRMHGAEVVAVGFPAPWREAHLVHRTIMLFEAATHLAALQDRERARLSPKLNAALDEGRAIARADYAAALAQRDAAIAFFTDWLAGLRRGHRAAGARPGARGPRLDRRSVVLHAVVADRIPGASRCRSASPATACRSACSSPRPPARTIACSRSRRGARRGCRSRVSSDRAHSPDEAREEAPLAAAAEGAQSRSRARRCSARAARTARRRRRSGARPMSRSRKQARDPEAFE